MHFTDENAKVLLYGLGHVMNALAAGFGSQNSFKDDRFSYENSIYNTHLVEDHCVK